MNGTSNLEDILQQLWELGYWLFRTFIVIYAIAKSQYAPKL